MIPIYFMGDFQTVNELVNVENLCKRYNFNPEFIEFDTLSEGSITANTQDRCYLCKKMMFERILKIAKKYGCKYVMDGTNASDDPSTRPGMRALSELGIRSPLRECGLTKEDIRRLSREEALPTSDIPSNSCLATRIPFGTVITKNLLQRTYQSENKIRVMGFKDIRVRTKGNGALLEVTPAQKELLDEKRSEIEEILLKYYDSVDYGERIPQP